MSLHNIQSEWFCKQQGQLLAPLNKVLAHFNGLAIFTEARLVRIRLDRLQRHSYSFLTFVVFRFLTAPRPCSNEGNRKQSHQQNANNRCRLVSHCLQQSRGKDFQEEIHVGQVSKSTTFFETALQLNTLNTMKFARIPHVLRSCRLSHFSRQFLVSSTSMPCVKPAGI